MSAFNQAQTRLEQALTRLETVLGERDIQAGGSEKEATLMSDIKGLRDECGQLRGKLDSSNKRYARMQEVVGGVASRLDKTIGELDAILER